MPVKKESRRRGGNEVWVENPKVKGGGYWRKFKPGKDQQLAGQNQAQNAQSTKSVKSKSPLLAAGVPGIVAGLTAMGLSAVAAGAAVKAVGEMKKKDQAFLAQSAIANINPDAKEVVVNSLLGKAGVDPKNKNLAANIAKTGLIAGAVTASLPPAIYGAAVLRYRSNFDNNIQEAEELRVKMREKIEQADLSQDVGEIQFLTSAEKVRTVKDENIPSDVANKKSEATTFILGGFDDADPMQDRHGINRGLDLYQSLRYGSDKKGRSTEEVDNRFAGQQFFVVSNYKGKTHSVLSNLVQSKNNAAIELAATIAAYRDVFPDQPINLVAESGGGLAAAEAMEYLERMGVKDLKSASLGTPYYGVTKEAKSSKQVTFNTPFDHVTTGSPVRNEININEVKDHNRHLKSDKVKELLSDFFSGKDISSSSERREEISEQDKKLKMRQYKISHYSPSQKEAENKFQEALKELSSPSNNDPLSSSVDVVMSGFMVGANEYRNLSVEALNWYIDMMKRGKGMFKKDSKVNGYRTDKKSRRQGNKVWVKDPSVSGGGYWRKLPDGGFQNQYTAKRRQEIEDYPVERTRSSKSKSGANPVGQLIAKSGSSSNSDAFKKFLAVGLVAAGAGVAGAVVADVATKNFMGKGMIASALDEEGDEIPKKPNFFEKIVNRLETDEKAQIAVGVVGVAGLGVAGTALYVQAQRNKAIDDAKKKLEEEEKKASENSKKKAKVTVTEEEASLPDPWDKENPPGGEEKTPKPDNRRRRKRGGETPPPAPEGEETPPTGEEKTPKPDNRRRRKRGGETPPPAPEGEETPPSGEGETPKPDNRRRRKRPSAQEKEVIKEAVEEIKESSFLPEPKPEGKKESKNKKTQGVEYSDTGLVFGDGMFEEFEDETGAKKIRPNEKAIAGANGKMCDDLYSPFYEKSLKDFRQTIDSGEFLENPFAGKNPRNVGKKILEQAVESYKKDDLDINDPNQAKAVLARLERAVIAQNLRERALWDMKKEIRDYALQEYMAEASEIPIGYGQGEIDFFNKRSKEISKSVKEQLQLAYDLVNDPDNFAAEIERRYGKEKRADSLAYYLVA